MNTLELYEKLCKLDVINGELSFDEKMITWRFHENLCIEAFSEDEDTYIGVENQGFHYHPDEDDMFQELRDINDGEYIFVSKVGMFGRYVSCVFSNEYYEKHRRWIRFGFGIKCFTSQGIII